MIYVEKLLSPEVPCPSTTHHQQANCVTEDDVITQHSPPFGMKLTENPRVRTNANCQPCHYITPNSASVDKRQKNQPTGRRDKSEISPGTGSRRALSRRTRRTPYRATPLPAAAPSAPAGPAPPPPADPAPPRSDQEPRSNNE
jgi:hypothetical protein